MSRFFKKALFWVILIALIIAAVLFISRKIESNKTEKKGEKSENGSNQKTPKPPNNDSPPDNPEPTPIDTENWWLADEEIEYAYQEIRKEITNSLEIQLVSPSVVRVIQEGGEISEDLKKAKIIFFPINNATEHETAEAGSHWTLLALHKVGGILAGYHYNSLGSSAPVSIKKLTDNLRQKLNVKEENIAQPTQQNPPQQTNGSDCGIYVIAFTRALTKRFQEGNAYDNWGLTEQDLIFSIAKERQKLKNAGFPKKGTPGKDYDIGDDVDYRESEENLILEWYQNPDTPIRKAIEFDWDYTSFGLSCSATKTERARSLQEFSKKIRLLSGVSKLEKEKLKKIYRYKKYLKACSYSPTEYQKNFGEFQAEDLELDKYVKKMPKGISRGDDWVQVSDEFNEINQLYITHFP